MYWKEMFGDPVWWLENTSVMHGLNKNFYRILSDLQVKTPQSCNSVVTVELTSWFMAVKRISIKKKNYYWINIK